ncbi:MAG: DUF3592 domain-containing protein [Okeania sp. SIO2G4]|uniref:DUF3592 domain-containing protein n=1 Tax=unclassified Okeania TaxID=2634635 RepID=UPI0013BBBA08|nr:MULTISPECIES: DUF3592 domain-containing protein [unclassified Okeania]NEP05470.1 DUF3592 domain-containing protein [Okeania sp. SIO4D6]NEP39988.1 DUF3592 domain-containing protein [Okeania sp. SIO2H7]NEP72902.1 DUF3592 domain-containing protein [Okeania sp. SIO2G5]NEP93712.1 DUF3592 domain-containing protein [Okeania sp. SIO2F5]NEQ93180.1 DUF3592 domain-containing protein [Okeania sp. SIO2G4]
MVRFLIFIYASGFGLLGYGIYSACKSVEASNWPSVTGTITNVSLHENKGRSITYEVKVKYRYSVRGKTYTSSRLAFGYFFSSGGQEQQDILNKLKSASSVKVRYSQKNPATSTLSFGIHRSIKFVLAFAIVWLGFTCSSSVVYQPDHVLLKNLKVTPKR